MPAIQPGSTVLVTGASGFIASHIIKTALEQGYKVRGTVRSESKGEYLKNLYNSGDFTYFLVPDVATAGALDKAAEGVEAIIHAAGETHGNFKTPDEFIKPAVDGTLNALKSIGPSVKRVIITSSASSVAPPSIPSTPKTYTPADWNDESVDIVKAKGAEAGGVQIYFAGKTLAERAAWDHIKSVSGVDLVVIAPSFTVGPILHECPTPDKLCVSLAMTLFGPVYKGMLPSEPETTNGIFSFIDVRDVANAHVKALSVPEAAGKRLFLMNEPFTLQQFLDIAVKEGYEIPNKGYPGGSDNFVPHVLYDNSEMKKILGINALIGKEQTLRDTFESFKKRGW